MTFIYEMFVLVAASFWFMPLAACLLIFTWLAVEKDNFFWSVLFSSVIGALVLSRYPEFRNWISNPINILITLSAYFLIGVAWGFSKWVLQLKKRRNSFVALRDDYLRKNKFPDGYFGDASRATETEIKMFMVAITTWLDRIDYGNHPRDRYDIYSCDYTTKSLNALMLSIRPKVSNNKEAIILWIMYWPMSMIWFVISDLMRDLAEAAYNSVATMFQSISDRMFKNLL